MKETDAVRAVTDVLKEIQRISGREIVEVSGNSCPIGDLPGFDSLSGVEATVELSNRLGVDLPGVNAFVNEKGTRALRVSEIAENICAASTRSGS